MNDEHPIIHQTTRRTVVIGTALRQRLEAAAAAQGGDASWLARRLIRRGLDVAADAPFTARQDGRDAGECGG